MNSSSSTRLAKKPPPNPLPSYLQDTVRMEIIPERKKLDETNSLCGYRMFILLPSDEPEMGPNLVRELCFSRQFIKPLKFNDEVSFFFEAFAKTALREKHKHAELIIRLVKTHPELLQKTYRVVGAQKGSVLLVSPIAGPPEAAKRNIARAKQILPPKGLFRNRYLYR
jgi:hypothetical protein